MNESMDGVEQNLCSETVIQRHYRFGDPSEIIFKLAHKICDDCFVKHQVISCHLPYENMVFVIEILIEFQSVICIIIQFNSKNEWKKIL